MARPMAQKRVRILLVQIVNRNLGDGVIADNTEYLLQKALKKAGIRNGCILRHDIASGGLAPLSLVQAVVFSGGGLIKFRQEKFYQNVIDLVTEANRLGVPVFFNSVGVEGYDAQDPRCRSLQDAITLPCIKGFSCRDDLSTLQNRYLLGCYKQVTPVMDPAILCPETYRIKKQSSPIIGLGITRHKLFAHYGTEGIDHDFLLQYWKEVTLQLESAGLPWEIFTNGLGSDEAFAEEVLAYIGHGTKAKRPAEPRQLVELISGYRAVIAGRMHSNIIAYSFGIPSIGFVWNEKLRFWGEQICHSERFLSPEQILPEVTVQALQEALAEGCSPITKEQKKQLLAPLISFLQDWVQPDEQRTPSEIDYSNRLVATALGGSYLQYKNRNTTSSLASSLSAGFRLLEVDLRLTGDQKLVCVNGWNKGTYQRLGLPTGEGQTPPLDEEFFLKQRYYQNDPTCNFSTCLNQLSAEMKRQSVKEITLILDVDLPTAKERLVLFQELSTILLETEVEKKGIHCQIRLQREKDVKAYKATSLRLPIIYYLPVLKEVSEKEPNPWMKAIQYAKQQHISTLSMNAELWNETTAQLLRENDLQALVLSYSKAGNLKQALDLGATLVGSHYFGPTYMTQLTD